MFNKTYVFSISGLVNKIEKKFFENVQGVNIIESSVENLGLFYYKNGIEWLHFIN